MAADTRERILYAALQAFLSDGYERTTVSRIRERAGVSNGSLFHFFATKEAIAEALYVSGISSFQEGLWELVDRPPATLYEAVRETIAHQLSWIEENPDMARFVYLRGHLGWDSPGGAEVQALNQRLTSRLRDWLAPFVERGEVRVTSMLLVTAIVSGPGHAVAQRWLAGHLEKRPTTFVPELATAAYAGLTTERKDSK